MCLAINKVGGKVSEMYPKRVINKERLRKISSSFSWIDHRFINQGFIKELQSIEILVYLFLVTVGDRYGLSFYGDDRICRLLKIDKSSLCSARDKLILKSFIEYKDGIYQVLELPRGIFVDGVRSSQESVFRVSDILREVLTAQEKR